MNMRNDRNKLVRDRIPRLLSKVSEVKPIVRELSAEEFLPALYEKLSEEVTEFLKDHHEDELADIIEVVYAIARERGIPRKKLERLRVAKAKRNGAFKKRLFLIGVGETVSQK